MKKKELYTGKCVVMLAKSDLFIGGGRKKTKNIQEARVFQTPKQAYHSVRKNWGYSIAKVCSILPVQTVQVGKPLTSSQNEKENRGSDENYWYIEKGR